MLTQAEREGLLIRAPQVSRELRSLSRSVDRLSGSVLFAALLLGGIWLYEAGQLLPGQALLGFAGLILVWMLFAPRRRG